MSNHWITLDRIFWVFKNKLEYLNQAKLVINPNGEIHITEVNPLTEKPGVIYHFINQNEFDTWLDSLQKDGDPSKTYKSILRKRNSNGP